MSKRPFAVVIVGMLAIAKTQDDLGKIRTIDWDKLNPQRGALIERFNREIKL